MTQRLNWILAGSSVALAGSLLITSCTPGAPTPGVSPSAPQASGSATIQAKDYHFPPSAHSQYTYLVTTTVQMPAGNATPSFVATSSIAESVSAWTATQSTVTQAVGGVVVDYSSLATISIPPNSQGPTITWTVQSDGSLWKSTGPGSATESIPNAELTRTGATVMPASGPMPAEQASLVDTESVIVPAGTYTALKIRFAPAGLAGAYDHDDWRAKNVGLVKTMGAPIYVPLGPSPSASNVATVSQEQDLVSFAP